MKMINRIKLTNICPSESTEQKERVETAGPSTTKLSLLLLLLLLQLLTIWQSARQWQRVVILMNTIFKRFYYIHYVLFLQYLKGWLHKDNYPNRRIVFLSVWWHVSSPPRQVRDSGNWLIKTSLMETNSLLKLLPQFVMSACVCKELTPSRYTFPLNRYICYPFKMEQKLSKHCRIYHKWSL